MPSSNLVRTFLLTGYRAKMIHQMRRNRRRKTERKMKRQSLKPNCRPSFLQELHRKVQILQYTDQNMAILRKNIIISNAPALLIFQLLKQVVTSQHGRNIKRNTPSRLLTLLGPQHHSLNRAECLLLHQLLSHFLVNSNANPPLSNST